MEVNETGMRVSIAKKGDGRKGRDVVDFNMDRSNVDGGFNMKKRQKNNQRRDAGFTLIEILLVVVIIGILAAVAIPNLVGSQEKALRNAAKQGISVIESAVSRYEIDNGKLPDSLQSLVTKDSEGRTYIRKAEGLKDPWGTEYSYTKQGYDFAVISAGPDKNFGGEDDIK